MLLDHDEIPRSSVSKISSVPLDFQPAQLENFLFVRTEPVVLVENQIEDWKFGAKKGHLQRYSSFSRLTGSFGINYHFTNLLHHTNTILLKAGNTWFAKKFPVERTVPFDFPPKQTIFP